MSRSISCEIVTLGKLIRDTQSFVIPAFQRNYAWGEKQYSAFWEDLARTFWDDSDDYFLGTGVFTPGKAGIGGRQLTVIDGQQRLTTTVILLSALRHHLRMRRLDELADKIESDFLKGADPETGAECPRFILNAANKNTFIEYIYKLSDMRMVHDRKKGKRSSNTNVLLLSCFMFMHKQIANARAGYGLSLQELFEKLMRSIEMRVTLINILVKDDYNAFVLFETLNERGMELSQFDLLKNYLLTTARPYVAPALSAWTEMETNLQNQSIASFMRQHWVSRGRVIEEKYLFAELRNQVKSPRQARAYLDALARDSLRYAALNDSEHGFWHSFDKAGEAENRKQIRALRSLGVQQPFVVLLAALDVCDGQPEQCASFSKLLRMLVSFTFRYTTICGKPPHKLGPAYAKAAAFIREKSSLSVDEIFEKFLSPLYPKDEEFTAAFRSKTSQDSAVCRYILASINDTLVPGAPPVEPDLASVDHILPQNPSPQWLEVRARFKSGFKPYISRLGNMTLMAPGQNQKIGNAGFAEKRAAFLQDGFEITRRVAEARIWTPKEIDKRQKWMAGIAAQIWRCP